MAPMADSTPAGETYRGFEQGPIRPPSEARSLLIRVTRNCPWNRCTFCPVYKGTRFSLRPVEHVKRDIDAVARQVDALRVASGDGGRLSPEQVADLARGVEPDAITAFNAASHWFVIGRMRSIFLQDANSLVVRPERLIEILTHLRNRFPEVRRITSYARSDTIARRSADDLAAIARAGLNRIHIGMESGCDDVLAMVEKGATAEKHVTAGRKVKQAGMELSEYIMPGLGGRRLSDRHARDTADALNRIDPDFIRIRTLAIPPTAPLWAEHRAGRFEKCPDAKVVEELLTLIECLDGIASTVLSDHILNLLQHVRGRLPRDRDRMLETLRSFLALSPPDRMVYQVGRRAGLFNCVCHMESLHRRAEAEELCRRFGVTPGNVDAVADELAARFI